LQLNILLDFMYSWMIYINGDLDIFLLIFAHYYIYLFQLGIENGGREFEKRALQRVKDYEKGQYSYFHLLNIKNVFQHYIFSSLHQIQCIYMTHCLYIYIITYVQKCS